MPQRPLREGSSFWSLPLGLALSSPKRVLSKTDRIHTILLKLRSIWESGPSVSPRKLGIKSRIPCQRVLLYLQSLPKDSVVPMLSVLVDFHCGSLEKPAGPLFWRFFMNKHRFQSTSPTPKPTKPTQIPRLSLSIWTRRSRSVQLKMNPHLIHGKTRKRGILCSLALLRFIIR